MADYPTNGDDTIVGTDGPDKIDALGGNDRITGGKGADKIYGNSGNDTVYVGVGDAATGETLDGGTGTDTLELADNADLSPDNPTTNFETLQLDGDVTIGANQLGDFASIETDRHNYIRTLTGAAVGTTGGTFSLANKTINSYVHFVGSKYGDTITGSSGNDWLRGGGGADTIKAGLGDDTVYIASGDVAAGEKLDGEGGTDTLEVANDVDLSPISPTTNFETLQLDGDVTIGANQLGDFASIETDRHNYIRTLTGAAVGTTGGTFSLANKTINSYVHFVGSKYGDTITGSSGNDWLRGGGGADTIKAGLGDDTVYIASGDVAAGEKLDGEGGTDTLEVANDVDLSPISPTTNFETLQLDGDVTIGANQLGDFASIETDRHNYIRTLTGAAVGTTGGTFSLANKTINSYVHFVGSKYGDTITGSSGNDWLRGGGGADTIKAGLGDDTVYIASGDVAAGEKLDGEGGTDTLEVANDVDLSPISPTTNFETLQLDGDVTIGANQLGDFASIETDRHNYIRTLTGAAVGTTGGTFSLANKTINSYVHFVGSKYGDTITGSSGNDWLRGGGGADTIKAGLGDDTVYIASGDVAAGEKLDGEGGTDTLEVANDVDLSPISPTTNFETLQLDGDVTIGANQLGDFSIISGDGRGSYYLDILGSGTIGNASLAINRVNLSHHDASGSTGQILTLGSGVTLQDGSLYDNSGSGGGIVNKGFIKASLNDESFTIGGNKFTNQGAISVSNGASLYIQPTSFTNLSGTTLTGGSYTVGSGSTLHLIDNVTIRTLAASITLSGNTSAIVSLNTFANPDVQVTLDSTLATVTSAGAFRIIGGRNFTAVANGGTFSLYGVLQLGGGTFQATKLTVASTTTILGYGTVKPAIGAVAALIANVGTLASGTLALLGAVAGVGALEADAHAVLQLNQTALTSVTKSVTLNGVGSRIQFGTASPFNTLETSLSGIASTGTLAVIGARGYVTTKAFTDGGLFTVAGGTITAGSLSVGSTGRIVGYATFTNAIANAGTIEAGGGVLRLAGGLTGSGRLLIDAGATLDPAGKSVAGSVTVATGGLIQGFGTFTGSVTDNGTIDARGGLLKIAGNVYGGGGLRVEGAATLELGGTASRAVTFASGAIGTLQLDASPLSGGQASFTGAIGGLAVGDAIKFSFETVTSATISGGTLTVAGSGGTTHYAVSGALTGNHFAIQSDHHTIKLVAGAAGAAAGADLVPTMAVAAAWMPAEPMAGAASRYEPAATLPQLVHF